MAEKKRTRLRICELNPHLLCALCGGYLIDATTIVECLHSFCKTCILRYLETSNYCPICEVLIHKKRPWQNIRLDHTLQNAVYKLVPGLFKREMQRRRDFYEKNPPSGGKDTEQVHTAPERIIFSEDEKFSVSLEFSPNGRAVQIGNEKSVSTTLPHHDKRFLLCPASVCIGHLKKFVRLKYTLPECYQIDLFYSDEPLEDTYTLMDIAYIYSWRRENVLTLYYSFYRCPRKRRIPAPATATSTSQDHDRASTSKHVKTKSGATSASSSNSALTTTTTTSTVTIVEAADSGGVTDKEGTKTTVSLSLPATTALPRPPPPTRHLLSSQTDTLVDFDDDDDDDDDERPLIIVTDTASATPVEADLLASDSGVTIINHPKTAGSVLIPGGSGDAADGLVVPGILGLLPQSVTKPSAASSKTVVSVAVIGPGDSHSDTTTSPNVTESSRNSEELPPADQTDLAHSVHAEEKSCSSLEPAHATESAHSEASHKGPHVERDQLAPVDQPCLAKEHLCSADPQKNDESLQQLEPQPLLEPASSSQATRPVEQNVCPVGPQEPKSSSGSFERPPQSEENRCSAETSCPAKSPRPAESSVSAEPVCPSKPSAAAEVVHQSDSYRPNEKPRAKESPRPKELLPPQEVPRPSDQDTGSSKNTSNGHHRDSGKKEARSISVVKESTIEASSSSSSPRRSGSNSSSMGIFERIYSVTSNCTASGIKSIFKTTAIVPAQASRRYSDVGNNSSVAALGERRGSTGGGGGGGTNTKLQKSSSDGKQEATLSQESRSSLDALTQLAKQSKLGSSEGSKTQSSKLASHKSQSAKETQCGVSYSFMPKSSEKWLKANNVSNGTSSSCKRTSISVHTGASSKNEVGGSPVHPVSDQVSDGSISCVGNNNNNNKSYSSEKARTEFEKRTAAPTSSGHNVHGTVASSNASFAADLRVKLPRCNINDENTLTAEGQSKDGHHVDSPGTARMKSNKQVQNPHSSSKASEQVKPPDVIVTSSSNKSLSECGAVATGVVDKCARTQTGSSTGISNQQSNSDKHSPSKKINTSASVNSSQPNNTCAVTVRKEQILSNANDKRPVHANNASIPTSSNSKPSKLSNAKTSTAEDCKVKAVYGSHAAATIDSSRCGPNKGEASDKKRDSVAVKCEAVGSSGGVRREGGVKRPYSSIASNSERNNNVVSSVQRLDSTCKTGQSTGAARTSVNNSTAANHVHKVTSLPAHHRVPNAGAGTGALEAKRAKLTNSSASVAMSHAITPTILSSSSACTSSSSSKAAHHAASGGAVGGDAQITSAISCLLSASKATFGNSLMGTSGVAKIRPAGNPAMSGGKLLAPGQRVDSLLFRATNRLAAAAVAKSVASSPLTAPTGQKKARSESVDSRMSFINKTFGGGKSSKETCVSPSVSRSEISFSARHILSPTFHSHSSSLNKMGSSSASAGKMTPAAVVSANRDKNSSSGERDLTKKSASAGNTKDGLSNGSSSRGSAKSMKLDIPRLSSSSRDSVFASDPESSPTPPPKYSDINRNPIKLEPGSKLCRRETWLPPENGGRMSAGSVGSPSSLGSGPGSPLESERSPVRDTRRPSDAELLLSQRWHGLHPHPLLAIPHHRDPATAAAVAAAVLYNGRFKVPVNAKYLPIAPDHLPRSASPEPMPLDYSTTSSSASSK